MAPFARGEKPKPCDIPIRGMLSLAVKRKGTLIPVAAQRTLCYAKWASHKKKSTIQFHLHKGQKVEVSRGSGAGAFKKKITTNPVSQILTSFICDSGPNQQPRQKRAQSTLSHPRAGDVCTEKDVTRRQK
jgi:hypothetical protein